ncbi:HAD family hydrolase [Acinetobacter colistiniresistens]|uniref:HAD family hydrolase n=1 Tax=Acinetobacter colistiniresistens TaxID=280145 RepID=UPI00124F9073|nr:HAD-IA family hydrolase [Acinetobacter colistiniresistens]
MITNKFLHYTKKKIAEAEIVSFDIFDTLLLRPYLSPRDVFLHIEIDQCLEGFSIARREAEFSARKRQPNKQDITYDDIYNEIEAKFKCAKETELNWEFMVLQPNPEMKILWDYALELKKRVIVVSDMYHSFDTLKKLLIKNGFHAFEHLYVSSAYCKTKKKGTLFQQVISDLQVNSRNIVHIGDNKNGDFRAPAKLGIKAILYQQVAHQFLAMNTKARKFNEQSAASLGQSILVAMLAMRWLKSSLYPEKYQYWEEIGYAYAGPLAYGYTRWIDSIAQEKEIDHLLFVARDGYLLKQAFEAFHVGKIKSSYVYAPRLLNLIYRLDYDKQDLGNTEAIVNFYAKNYSDIYELKKKYNLIKANDYHLFIQEHKRLFEGYAKQMYTDYTNYIHNIVITNERLGIIDTKTIAFTSQKMLEDVLDKPMQGFYWSTIFPYHTRKYAFNTFIPNNLNTHDPNVFTQNWKFVELLLSAPEFPIGGISPKGNPIYINNSPEAIVLKNNYLDINKGAENLFSDIHEIFVKTNIYLESRDLVSWVNVFCESPDKIDFEEMAKVKLAVDVSHSSYKPLFSTKTSFIGFLKNPKTSLNILKNTPWLSYKQSFLLHMFRPIKIKKNSSKKLQINLFPYLKLRGFVWTFLLFRKISFRLTFGNHSKN